MDAFNTSLDAYEADLNRIEPLDLPRFVSMSKNMPDAHGTTPVTGMSRSPVARPEEQYGEIEAVWEEESQNWEPTTMRCWDRSAHPGMMESEKILRDAHRPFRV